MLHIGGVVSHREFGYIRLEVELLGESLDPATLAKLEYSISVCAAQASVPEVTNSAYQLHLPRYYHNACSSDS